MTKQNSTSGRIGRPDSDALEIAQAEERGSDFNWHYGRVTRLGTYGQETAAERNRMVTILWESGGLSCQQGGISDAQWEILKLAFKSTGMVSVLSDEAADGWMYDYRFLECVR